MRTLQLQRTPDESWPGQRWACTIPLWVWSGVYVSLLLTQRLQIVKVTALSRDYARDHVTMRAITWECARSRDTACWSISFRLYSRHASDEHSLFSKARHRFLFEDCRVILQVYVIRSKRKIFTIQSLVSAAKCRFGVWRLVRPGKNIEFRVTSHESAKIEIVNFWTAVLWECNFPFTDI